MYLTLLESALLAVAYWMFHGKIIGIGCGMFNHPLAIGFVVGLIMGDIPGGVTVGAMLQMLNMAPSMVGMTVTMDLQLGAMVAIPFVLATDLPREIAMVLAIPFFLLGSKISPWIRKRNSVCVELCEKAAEQASPAKYYWASIGVPEVILFFFRALPLFALLFGGQYVIIPLLNALPAQLIDGLVASGQLLMCLGIGMFLFSVRGKGTLAFFILGFFLIYVVGRDQLLWLMALAGVLAYLFSVLEGGETKA